MIHSLFLDPTGAHCIVTVRPRLGGGRGSSTVYYLHEDRPVKKKLKEIAKAKGVLIECIAWDRRGGGDRLATGSFLAGSADGVIYEGQLETKDGHNTLQEWHQLHNLSITAPICGMQFERLSARKSEPSSFFVMCCTANPTRYYHWVGNVSLDRLFSSRSAASVRSERQAVVCVPHNLTTRSM